MRCAGPPRSTCSTRPCGHPEVVGDAVVRVALCHQRQHLALSLRRMTPHADPGPRPTHEVVLTCARPSVFGVRLLKSPAQLRRRPLVDTVSARANSRVQPGSRAGLASCSSRAASFASAMRIKPPTDVSGMPSAWATALSPAPAARSRRATACAVGSSRRAVWRSMGPFYAPQAPVSPVAGYGDLRRCRIGHLRSATAKSSSCLRMTLAQTSPRTATTEVDRARATAFRRSVPTRGDQGFKCKRGRCG